MTSSNATPNCFPPGRGRGATESGGERFDWEALVPLVVHPTKVRVLDEIARLGRPQSATMLRDRIGEPRSHYLSSVSYHLRALESDGVLVKTGSRPVRGAEEVFFYFADPEAPCDGPELAGRFLHPTKVEILEAMDWIGPLSPNQLSKSFGMTVPSVAYHVRTLAELGVLEVTGSRPVRGAVETFHYFTPAMRTSA